MGLTWTWHGPNMDLIWSWQLDKTLSAWQHYPWSLHSQHSLVLSATSLVLLFLSCVWRCHCKTRSFLFGCVKHETSRVKSSKMIIISLSLSWKTFTHSKFYVLCAFQGKAQNILVLSLRAIKPRRCPINILQAAFVRLLLSSSECPRFYFCHVTRRLGAGTTLWEQ